MLKHLALLTLSLALLAAPALAGVRETPVVKAVRDASPAVVNIASTTTVKTRGFSTGDPMLDRFFGQFMGPSTRKRSSLGSGVIIDGRKGLIVTNSHVVSGAEEIQVQMADRRTFAAELLGDDPASDLAVLRIKSPERLPQVAQARPGDLFIGETTIAIGNPFGLQHTVTTGVVSAVGRRVPVGSGGWLRGLIQTDASINFGNSGGPLLNLEGRLIGINTAIFSRAQGIGFAIPVGRMQKVVADLLGEGEVLPVWLGLGLQDLTGDLAAHLGLKAPVGVMITRVYANSPAARAGLRRGGVILAVDGQPVMDVADFAGLMEQVAAGEELVLTLLLGEDRRDTSLTAQRLDLERADEIALNRLGLKAAEMDGETARSHGVRPGHALMVSGIIQGSAAYDEGIRNGDMILKIGGERLKTLRDFRLSLARTRHQAEIRVLFGRGRSSKLLEFKNALQ